MLGQVRPVYDMIDLVRTGWAWLGQVSTCNAKL